MTHLLTFATVLGLIFLYSLAWHDKPASKTSNEVRTGRTDLVPVINSAKAKPFRSLRKSKSEK